MSGTSVDAIDSALVRCDDSGVALLATHQHAIPIATRQRIALLSHPGDNEIEQMGVLDRELGLLFAAATLELLDQADTPASQVTAIGSHGQTIRHRPPSGEQCAAHNFTLQIGDPNTIAERTGITTVADFRRRDIAAGGEGAPLAPAFHAAAFASDQVDRAIVNIGGIANATLLKGRCLIAGFDTGPGNTLLDQWVQRHRNRPYDGNGDWSASGEVNEALLQRLLSHPYFQRSGPRSTGKETFNLSWLDDCLQQQGQTNPADVQATLAELTAGSIANAIAASELAVTQIFVCGGGAHNSDLLRRLDSLTTGTLQDTSSLNMDPDWVEAAAFAWLASRCLAGLCGNAPVVTGADGGRILGGVYRAG